MNVVLKPVAPVALAVALGGLAAAPAQATVRASEPNSIVAALHAGGYKAELGRDEEGDPKVSTGIAGLNVTVLFYGCTNHVACRSIQFFASLDTKGKMTLAKANDWNTRERWLCMHLDKVNDPIVDHDIDTSPSGLDDKVFLDQVNMLEGALGNLKTFAWGK